MQNMIFMETTKTDIGKVCKIAKNTAIELEFLLLGTFLTAAEKMHSLIEQDWRTNKIN